MTAEVPMEVVPVANSNTGCGIFHSPFSDEHTVTKHRQTTCIYKTPHTTAQDTSDTPGLVPLSFQYCSQSEQQALVLTHTTQATKESPKELETAQDDTASAFSYTALQKVP